jgi:ankyrin repeat protein
MGCGALSKPNKVQPQAGGAGAAPTSSPSTSLPSTKVAPDNTSNCTEQTEDQPPVVVPTNSPPKTASATTSAAIDGHQRDESGLFYMDADTTQHSTNLMAAVKRGDINTVKCILPPTADSPLITEQLQQVINTRGMWSSTPLITACQYGFTDIALLLLSVGKDCIEVNHVNERGATALLFACLENELEVVKTLLAPNTLTSATTQSTNTESETKTDNASKQVMIRTEPATGVYNSVLDRNIVGTPLSVACVNGHGHVIDLLIATMKASDSNAVNTPFPFATLFQTTNNAGANGTECVNMTPLSVCCAYGRIKSAQMLLQTHHADILATDSRGNTCLHHMARSNSSSNKTAAVDLLTVLTNYCVSTQTETSPTEKLKQLNLLCSVLNDVGETALHVACDSKAVDFVKKLLELMTMHGMATPTTGSPITHQSQPAPTGGLQASSSSSLPSITASASPTTVPSIYSHNQRVEAHSRKKGAYCAGTVTKIRADGTVDVSFDSGELEMRIKPENVRALNSSKAVTAAKKDMNEVFVEGQQVEANKRGKGTYVNGKVIKVRAPSSSDASAYMYDIVYDSGEMEMRVKAENVRSSGGSVKNSSSKKIVPPVAKTPEPVAVTTPTNKVSVGNSVSLSTPLNESAQELDLNSWINIRSHSGSTALHIAVKKRSLEIVTLLVNAGANPLITESASNGDSGSNAVELARKCCNNKRDGAIITLLESLTGGAPVVAVSAAPLQPQPQADGDKKPSVTVSAPTAAVVHTPAPPTKAPTAPTVPTARKPELPPASSALGARSGRKLVQAAAGAHRHNNHSNNNSGSSLLHSDKSDELRKEDSTAKVALSQAATPVRPTPPGHVLATPAASRTGGNAMPLVTPSAIDALFDATPVVVAHK